jgi:hypothetical protein
METCFYASEFVLVQDGHLFIMQVNLTYISTFDIRRSQIKMTSSLTEVNVEATIKWQRAGSAPPPRATGDPTRAEREERPLLSLCL